MGAQPLRGNRNGWSYGPDRPNLPRHELPAEHMHSVEVPPDPESPAWDEPGYVDPDWHHANLPEGARYWQGYAKPSKAFRPGEERPLSPGWVARITRRHYPQEAALTTQEEMDPHWDRRIRRKERNILSLFRSTIWPG
jgi:hypothetical protein